MRCEPSTRASWMMRCGAAARPAAGAGQARSAGRSSGGWAAARAAGARLRRSWRAGIAPDSIVPASKRRQRRALPNFVALIRCHHVHPNRRQLPSRHSRTGARRPALTASADQPGELLPQPRPTHRSLNVTNSISARIAAKPAAKRPFLDCRSHRPPPYRLDRVEQQMPAIEHGDWQQVDEPQINRDERDQADEARASPS